MKIKTWTIYKHTLKEGFDHSGWSYIGQTCSRIPEKRWGINGAGYAGTVFGRAIVKYGWNNFEHTILESNLTLEEANEREEFWISFYHTWIDDPQCYGYNMDKGGKNHCQSSLQKQYLSKINRGKQNIKNKQYKYIFKDNVCKKVMPNDLQAYLDAGWMLGNGQKGKSRNTHKTPSNDIAVLCIETQEIFKSASAAHKVYGGNVMQCINSEYFRTAGGYHWARVDDFTRIKLLQQYIGNKPVASDCNGKPCICIETGKKYPTISAAIKDTGIQSIKQCCAGKIKTAGKMHWKYISKDEIVKEKENE